MTRISPAKTLATAGFLLLAAGANAQDLHRNNFFIGGGAAIPSGNATQYLGVAPMFAFGYGYRLNHWFQADAGLQMAFGAANNQNAVQTDLGPVQGGDHEFMIPLGGRVYIPLPFKRFSVSAGGGGIYLHYSETAPSSGYYTNNCYTCTSRGGWGGYGLGDVSYALDENRNFKVGTTLEFISASTNGQPVGNIPGIKTTDHWTTLNVYFGLSF